MGGGWAAAGGGGGGSGGMLNQRPHTCKATSCDNDAMEAERVECGASREARHSVLEPAVSRPNHDFPRCDVYLFTDVIDDSRGIQHAPGGSCLCAVLCFCPLVQSPVFTCTLPSERLSRGRDGADGASCWPNCLREYRTSRSGHIGSSFSSQTRRACT